jgi:hypothetical protein
MVRKAALLDGRLDLPFNRHGKREMRTVVCDGIEFGLPPYLVV